MLMFICRYHPSGNAFHVSFRNLDLEHYGRGVIEILKVLVVHAESVTASDDGDGEAGAEAIFNARDEDGKSPMDYLGQRFLFEANNAEIIEQLLAMKIKGLRLESDDGWTLLHQCVSEGIVTPTILRALEHQLNIMDGNKKTPIFHAKKLETVLLFLNEDLKYLRSNLEDGTSLYQHCIDKGLISKGLSTVCEEENYEEVKILLKIPGIIDHETHDGLTGFAISLVKQNKDIIMAFLHSGIGSHQRNVFLASEFCRLPSVANIDLQRLIQQFLSSSQIGSIYKQYRKRNIGNVDQEKDTR